MPPVTRRFSTVTRPPPADTRELAGALCAVSPRSPAHLRRIRESSLEPCVPPTSFLHGHPSTSGGYELARWSPVCRLRRVVSPRSPVHLRRIRESSLEPCVPPTSFLHGHPSTSGGYERARWSPVCRLRRVVSPRSPVHLRRIRESSLEPGVPPTTRRFSTVTRPPPADTRELEPSAACDQTTPARHWGRWKIPESPCLPRTLWIRNVLVTPESTSATLQTRHCTMQWENLGPPWRGDQRLPCLPCQPPVSGSLSFELFWPPRSVKTITAWWRRRPPRLGPHSVPSDEPGPIPSCCAATDKGFHHEPNPDGGLVLPSSPGHTPGCPPPSGFGS